MVSSSVNAVPLSKSRQLRVMFVATSLPVGGEEVLLAEIVRRMDRQRFAPQICCLKSKGELGQQLASEVPVTSNVLSHKLDLRVINRLARLMRNQRVDAVVTVGTGGDKMFWGRLAALRARVPVVVSSIHSTGYPLRVEWSNRRLARFTDAFIAVAHEHGRFITEHEGCPAKKVAVIPNGVDPIRFSPQSAPEQLWAELGIPAGAATVGIIAQIRPEKNHRLWLQAAAAIHQALPDTHFLVVGDGPERSALESFAQNIGLSGHVHFAGRRFDIPQVLSLMNVFMLSSDMEANPVSILEAMAMGKPVVSTKVGSIPESVRHGETGFLVEPGDSGALARYATELLRRPDKAAAFGMAGRALVCQFFSSRRMVTGYEDLLERLYAAKQKRARLLA